MLSLKNEKAPEFLPKALRRPGTPNPSVLIFAIMGSVCQTYSWKWVYVRFFRRYE